MESVSRFAVRLKDGEGTGAIAGGEDACEAGWFSVGGIPGPLAFDHDRIVRDAFGFCVSARQRARIDRTLRRSHPTLLGGGGGAAALR